MLQAVNPDPAQLIDITNCANAIEAEMLAQFLDDHGVPAHASVHAGATNPWELGSSVPFRIAVRKQDAARAEELIREYRSRKHEPVQVNWDEEDVGEAEPDTVLPAPTEARRRHRRWWTMRRSAMAVFILLSFFWLGPLALLLVLVAAIIEFGVSRAESAALRCVHCGYSLAGLPINSRCPECGQLPDYASMPPQTDKPLSEQD